MQDEITISDSGINRVVLDIYDYLEKINSILIQIDDIMLSNKEYFKYNGENFIYNKYAPLNLNFEIVKANFESYADDLLKAVKKFKTLSSNLADEIVKQSSNIQSNNV